MAAYKKLNSGFLPFVQKEQVTSPYTDIQNRAKVDSSLKAIFGNERLIVNSLNELTNEFGPNGEKVYEPDNQDERIRFVGNVDTSFTTSGQHINLLGDGYAEVTFYGTGLNILHRTHATTIVIDAQVDGGPVSTFFNGASHSGILEGQNYKPFQITNVVSGLSLGWHTVKIVRNNDTPSINGFEILNESSQITVRAGKAHGNGYEYILDSDELIDYNLGFDNVLDANVGTRGGRVLIYIDPTDGSVKKRLTKTESTSLFMGAADHTNEAISRRLNYLEMGRNQSNDFSNINGTNTDRSFTLDDSATNLVGYNIRRLENSLFLDNSTIYQVSFTFVGTGLDLYWDNSDGGAKQISDIQIDGVSVGTNVSQPAGETGTTKVASGLPYGTHKVRIISSGSFNAVLNHFIVYQPKKPALPEGSVVLADYNIVADYALAPTFGVDRVCTGVIRKRAEKENVYVGTWGYDGNFESNGYIGGPQVYEASTTTGQAKISFYGTGFVIRHKAFSSYHPDIQLSLNGTDLTAANFPTATFQQYGYDTGFDSGDGTLDMRSAANNTGAGFSCSGLPLGFYELVMDKNGNGSTMSIETVDIITPIHSYHTTFGSRSLKDCRNFDSNKDVNKTPKLVENNILFNNVEGKILKSVGVSQVHKLSTGVFLIYFEDPFRDPEFYCTGTSDSDNSISLGLPEASDVQGRTLTSLKGRNRNLAGGLEDERRQNIIVKGFKQKDELEE